MKITIDEQPFEHFPYQIIPQGGMRDADGRRTTEKALLEIWKGTFTSEKLDLDALIATSDLQGIVAENGNEFLLGERLPDFLKLLLELEFPQIRAGRVGVLLCGDLYALPNKRGGLGDVRTVWHQFNLHFNWVAGVAGNHDDFGSKKELQEFRQERGLHLLSREIKKVDGLKIGGISGIIGATDKPNRLEEEDFLRTLKQLLLKQPDILLLHQGPDDPAKNLEGEPKIREILETSPSAVIFCGHRHWEKPITTLLNNTQVVNTDKRVVILQNATLSEA